MRTRLLGSMFALGIFATLPIPAHDFAKSYDVLVLALWVFFAALAWSTWFRPDLSRVLWVFCWIVSAVAFWKAYLMMPVVLATCWGAWFSMRTERETSKPRSNSSTTPPTPSLALLIACALVASSIVPLAHAEGDIETEAPNVVETPQAAAANATKADSKPPKMAAPDDKAAAKTPPKPATPEKTEWTQPESAKPDAARTDAVPGAAAPPKSDPKKEDEIPLLNPQAKRPKLMGFPKPSDFKKKAIERPKAPVIPKYLSGYEVRDLTSCSMIDQIPWKFRPDRRKIRLLLRDSLRHQTETVFATWEIHQVMDGDGFVSYVFRRALANGRFESIVTKDLTFNRIVDTPQGPKTTEVQDLRTLINRAALTFYHSDGSTVAYWPSSVGKSALIVTQGQVGGGRSLPPVYLRGNYCDRPDDEENSDAMTKKITPPAAAAPAAPAPGGK